MQYPLTDIQAEFEINWPVRYNINAKRIISTDRREKTDKNVYLANEVILIRDLCIKQDSRDFCF